MLERSPRRRRVVAGRDTSVVAVGLNTADGDDAGGFGLDDYNIRK